MSDVIYDTDYARVTQVYSSWGKRGSCYVYELQITKLLELFEQLTKHKVHYSRVMYMLCLSFETHGAFF